MGALTSLIILAVIAFGSLIIVSSINRYETKLAHTKLYQQTMQQRVDELVDLVLSIDPVLANRGIAREINQLVIEKFRQIHELEPAEEIAIALEAAEKRDLELSANPPDRRVNYVAGSDAAIAQMQKKLNIAGRVLKRLRDRGKIPEPSYKAYTIELRWAYLQVEMITYLHHGYKSRSRNDLLTATAFFKKAAEVLRTSGVSDDRKNQQIREVSEIIRGKRLKLSNQTDEEALLNEMTSNTVPTMSDEERAEAEKRMIEERRERARKRIRGEKGDDVDQAGFPIAINAPKRSF